MPGLAPRPWLPSLVYFCCSSPVFTRYTPVLRFHILRPRSSSLALVRSQVPLLKRRTRGLALRRRPWLPSLVYFRPSSPVFCRYTPVPRFHFFRPGSCSLALVRSLAPLLKRRTRGLALRRRSEPVSSSAGLADSLCRGGPSPSPEAPDSRTRSAAAVRARLLKRRTRGLALRQRPWLPYLVDFHCGPSPSP